MWKLSISEVHQFTLEHLDHPISLDELWFLSLLMLLDVLHSCLDLFSMAIYSRVKTSYGTGEEERMAGAEAELPRGAESDLQWLLVIELHRPAEQVLHLADSVRRAEGNLA